MASSKIVKNAVQYIFFFGLAVLLLWLAGKDMPFSELIEGIKKANKKPLLGIAIAGFASHIFRALRWRLLINSMGYQVGAVNTFFAVMIGYLINLATPRMGEVARCGILARYEKIPADKIAGTMVVERIFDFICLVLLMFSTFYIEYNRVNIYFMKLIYKIKANTNPIVLVSVCILLFSVILISVFYVNKMKNSENKVAKVLKNIGEGIMSIGKLEYKSLFLMYTLFIWISYFLMVYIGFNAMEELHNLRPGAALSVLSFGSIGILATPGGTGAYQLIIKEILSKLYFISPSASLTFGYLSWGVQNLILIVGGVFALIALPIYNKKNAPEI